MTITVELWELAAEGDERAVKRAYARALKQTRPDEDPAGFQQLHAAYQQALARCRALAGEQEPAQETAPAPVWTVETAAPADVAGPAIPDMPPAVPAEVAAPLPRAERVALPLPAQPAPDQAADALLHAAGTHGPAEFAAWLRGQAHAWSLDTRDAVANQVLHALREERVAMPEAHMDALYRAFGWDDIASGQDPRELHWHRHRADQAWMLQPAQRRALAALLQGRISGWLTPEETTTRLALLQQPQTHVRNLFSALLPSRTEHVAALMAVLGLHPGGPLPVGIDAGQATFWAAMTHEFSRVALQARLLRAGLLGVALVVAVCAAIFSGSQLIDWLLGDVDAGWRTPVAVLLALCAPALLIGTRVLYRFTHAWQGAPEATYTALPALRILTVPLLVVLIFGTWWLSAGTALGFWGIALCWALTWTTMQLARWRYRTRRGEQPPAGILTLLSLVVGTATLYPGMLVALGYWVADLWGHRRQLRWRNRAAG